MAKTAKSPHRIEAEALDERKGDAERARRREILKPAFEEDV